jgi:hypothetical protein
MPIQVLDEFGKEIIFFDHLFGGFRDFRHDCKAGVVVTRVVVLILVGSSLSRNVVCAREVEFRASTF